MLGYALGGRFGPPPTKGSHRVSGAIPGAASGAALAYYGGRNIVPGTQLAVHTPAPSLIGTYVALTLGIGFVVLLALWLGSMRTSKRKA